jgi:SAM-dependent methyltransferase
VDRREKLLSGLDLRATTGVEIGPLDNPVVSRDDGRIIYVDHQNAEELRQRFANNPDVAMTDIVEVDAIWGSNTLQEAIGAGVGVDYVVASHVVEHVPDLIRWLEELRAVLRPGGTVRLAVPDRRYTFDYLRRESSAVEVLSAYCVRTRIPLPYFIIDFMVNFAQVDVTAAWSDNISPDRLVRHHTIHEAIRVARHAHEEGAYHDVHCWVFTPRSFANLFAELAEIGLVRFSCAYFVDTAHNQLEFFVGLTPSDDTAQMVESWKQMARSVW